MVFDEYTTNSTNINQENLTLEKLNEIINILNKNKLKFIDYIIYTKDTNLILPGKSWQVGYNNKQYYVCSYEEISDIINKSENIETIDWIKFLSGILIIENDELLKKIMDFSRFNYLFIKNDFSYFSYAES